jgi:hypothetical protein
MSSFSLRDNLTIENGKALKWLDATGTNRRDILTLDGFNVVKMYSAGSDIYINSSVNSTTWVNVSNTNNVIVGSKLGIGTSTVSSNLTLSTNSTISTDSTLGSLSFSGGTGTNSSKIILNAVGTGGNLDLYGSTASASGLRFYSGASSGKRFHIYDTGLCTFTPDGSTIALSIDTTSTSSANPISIQNTTISSSTSTGALIVSGGVGIGRGLYSNFIVTNTVSSTVVTSGSLISLNGTIGSLVVTNISSGTLTVSGTSNSNVVSAGSILASGINITNGSIGALISTSSSIGSLVLGSTVDATGLGTGGALTINGGAAISKRLFANTLSLGSITNEFSGSFSGNNNVSTPADITGLSFSTTDTRSFTVTMAISILASSSLYAQAIIEGVWKAGNWEIFTSYLGDQTGITFSITSSGQLRYTSNNYVSWTSTVFRWSAKVINQTGTHNPPVLPTSGSQTITGPLTITSSVNTTSGSSGSLTVAGGVGIAGDLIVGGNIFSNILKTQIASSSFSVTESHKNFFFLVNSTMTITLLSAASAGPNYTVSFSKVDDLSTSIQIIPTSGTIEGIYTNYILTNFNDLVTFISDGTTWRILHSRTLSFANIYSVPGVYYFTVPNPVTKVYACVFGAGGGGGTGTLGTSSGNGGGGGGYTEGLITVNPGDVLTITVGSGGTADFAGEDSSVGDLTASGGGGGGINSIGSWGSVGSAGTGSGGAINRSGGFGGQSPSQFSGGGGGGGGAGGSGAGISGSTYLGGNGSGGYGGAGGIDVDTAGTSLRITNFYREGGGGGSGNLDTYNAVGVNGGFPGGGGSGSSDGSGGNGGDGCVLIYY